MAGCPQTGWFPRPIWGDEGENDSFDINSVSECTSVETMALLHPIHANPLPHAKHPGLPRQPCSYGILEGILLRAVGPREVWKGRGWAGDTQRTSKGETQIQLHPLLPPQTGVSSGLVLSLNEKQVGAEMRGRVCRAEFIGACVFSVAPSSHIPLHFSFY